MSAKKAYTRDGRWIWSETTNYSGEIVSETDAEVVIKYFYNPHSGIGYEQYHIRKEDIDEAKA